MNQPDYTNRICAADDFERACSLSLPLLKLRLQCEVADKRLSPGIANDTVAALLQARDLLRTMHQVGVELHDLQRWLVEWGRAWKEQEENESITSPCEGAQIQ